MKQYIMTYSEAGVQGFCPLPSTLCYNSSTRFPELVTPLFLLLDNFFVPATSLFTRIRYSSHKKRKDSLETQAKPAVFSL